MENSSALLRGCFLMVVCALAFGICGCSGGGGLLNPSPVHAQTYSNSSMSGTYAVSMAAGDSGDIVSPISFLGSIVFDGNGNVTSGTITEASTPYFSSTAACSVSASGTY